MTVENLFLRVFDLSLIGSAAIIIVAVARLLSSRLPKRYSYILWLAPACLLVGLRPFTSNRSFGLRETAGQAVTGVTFTGMPDSVFQAVEAAIPSLTPVPYTSVNPIQILTFIVANLWVVGVAAMLLHSLWTVVRLWLQLRGAAPLGNNVYLAHNIRTPFVMGLVRPRIYLPSGLADDEREYILLHERTHIRRCDHVIKPLAYLLLCVHWFNPLCWLGFYLLSRDMEMSCDEAVIGKLGSEVKQSYASSLLALASPRTIWCGSPLAFGEGHAGRRIKNLLDYKKPALWVTVLVIIMVAWLLVGMISSTPYDKGDWISQMYACRTESVYRQGEPIHKLAVLLPPTEGMKHEGSQLDKTERGGYRATVSYAYTYRGDNPEQWSPPPLPDSRASELRRNAIILMALNREVETVYTTYRDASQGSGVVSLVMIRDEATRLLGGTDPWVYSSSLESFRAFYNELDKLLANGSLSVSSRSETIKVNEGETAALPTYRERFEAPIFEFTPTGLDHGRADILAFINTFLDYYTNPATNNNWQGHINAKRERAGMQTSWLTGAVTNMDIAATYDLVLSDNPDADPTHWLATGGQPVTINDDGKMVVIGNAISLSVVQIDESHYALRSVTSYRPTDEWDEIAPNATNSPHLVPKLVEEATRETIRTYREGGLNVHQSMGDGFAAPPTDIIWSDFNYIMLRQVDGKSAQASVIVDDRYTMVMDISVEGTNLDTAVISTAFTKRD